jgi:ABC-type Fe3+/spermidine/putrescine transport system ATPase subunit
MKTSLRPIPFLEPPRPQLRAVSSAVVLRDLRREYGGREVVRGVSLEIPAGEIFGLLGPNGAGKTTLLSMISTRLRPASGDAWVHGKHVTQDVDAVRRLLNVAPQEEALYPSLTAAENMSFFAELYQVPRSAVRERPDKQRVPVVDEVLAQRLQRLIVQHPTFGYRRLWALLRFHEGLPINRKAVYRVLVLKGWFVHQPRMAPRPRVQGRRSRASRSNERWAMDVTHVDCGADGWGHLAAIIDCHDRELVGYEFARRGRAKEAERALEAACIDRFGTLRPAGGTPVLRSACYAGFVNHPLRSGGRWASHRGEYPGCDRGDRPIEPHSDWTRGSEDGQADRRRAHFRTEALRTTAGLVLSPACRSPREATRRFAQMRPTGDRCRRSHAASSRRRCTAAASSCMRPRPAS